MSQRLQLVDEQQIERWMWDIREYEAAHIFAKLIGDREFVLNVGPSWGRDFYHLSRLGKRVINADIAPQFHLDRLVLCDLTKGLPFPSQMFQVVLVAEVLEHLVNDVAALSESRRVLRDDGILVLSVPFYDDRPEYHVRIHSLKSIRRLLAGTGFRTIGYMERGGLVTWARFIHAVRKISKPIIRPELVYRIVTGVDELLARYMRQLLRISPCYGCYLVAQKAVYFDYQGMNAAEFRH